MKVSLASRSSTLMQSLEEASTLRMNSASARFFSAAWCCPVQSRRILMKPCRVPAWSRNGIISPLAQKRLPSLR